ncbi:MAG: hypothetical protein EVJ46_02530 [Candidatus Acididesulfobacter guangdongensis]|uniref:Uncharacterized protein n=1 Tax=Acididesulfobacter guangdongensis TaxID=2597225 RepID=A0A519BIP0_ACIG2|nr:MAG: hypothetical protein EVJ46_02530 [Candidatus Acididesulfobacter guangdongensis]
MSYNTHNPSLNRTSIGISIFSRPPCLNNRKNFLEMVENHKSKNNRKVAVIKIKINKIIGKERP